MTPLLSLHRLLTQSTGWPLGTFSPVLWTLLMGKNFILKPITRSCYCISNHFYLMKHSLGSFSVHWNQGQQSGVYQYFIKVLSLFLHNFHRYLNISLQVQVFFFIGFKLLRTIKIVECSNKEILIVVWNFQVVPSIYTDVHQNTIQSNQVKAHLQSLCSNIFDIFLFVKMKQMGSVFFFGSSLWQNISRTWNQVECKHRLVFSSTMIFHQSRFVWVLVLLVFNNNTNRNYALKNTNLTYDCC